MLQRIKRKSFAQPEVTSSPKLIHGISSYTQSLTTSPERVNLLHCHDYCTTPNNYSDRQIFMRSSLVCKNVIISLNNTIYHTCLSFFSPRPGRYDTSIGVLLLFLNFMHLLIKHVFPYFFAIYTSHSLF